VQERENERCQNKKPVEVGITVVENIEVGGKYPKKQPDGSQINEGNHITHQGAQKTSDFF